jgi:Protein of unknown function with PCYCGC motif
MANDKYRREFLWALSMGLGIACTGRTLSWADAASAKMPLRRTPNGDWLETVPAGQLPSFALNKSEKVKEAYRYAVDNEDTLQYIPCFCGCKNIGHQHNAACYVTERLADGQVTFNSHAVG